MVKYQSPVANDLPIDRTESLEYAGFWVRMGATLIDLVIMLGILLPVEIYILKEYYGIPFGYPTSGLAFIFVLEWVVPAVITLVFWVTKSATPGKMAFRMKILDADTGQPASTLQLLGRYVGYFVSLIPCGIGYVWVGVDARKQGWHDKLAGTVVVQNLVSEPVRFKNRTDIHPRF